MRIDLFLKASRLVIRRSVAQALCDAGAVRLNETTTKSSHAVKIGDLIGIIRGDRVLTVRVTAVPASKQTSREAAAKLYEIISGGSDDLGTTDDQE